MYDGEKQDVVHYAGAPKLEGGMMKLHDNWHSPRIYFPYVTELYNLQVDTHKLA